MKDSPHYSETDLAIPVLVLVAGNTTDEVKMMCKSLTTSPLDIPILKNSGPSYAFSKNNIRYGSKVSFQYIYCPSLGVFKQYEKILGSNKDIMFYNSYSVLVVIDYTVNRNIVEIRETFKSRMNIAHTTGFVFYKGGQDIAEYGDSDTLISLDSYKSTGYLNHIHEFVSGYALNSFCNKINKIKKKQRLHSKMLMNIKLSLGLISTSGDLPTIIESVGNSFKIAEKKDATHLMGSLLEILGLVAMKNPDLVIKSKFLPSEMTVTDPVDRCFTMAVGFYERSGAKCHQLLVILRLISIGRYDLIETARKIVEENIDDPLILYPAIELVRICNQYSMNRKAIFLAFNFFWICPELEKVHFQKEFLRLFKLVRYGSYECSVLLYPLMKRMIKSQYLSAPVISDTCLTLISKADAYLSLEAQSEIFSALIRIEKVNFSETPFPLKLSSATVVESNYEITEVVQRANGSGPFLYNALQQIKEKKSFCNFNEGFFVTISVTNPLKINLEPHLTFKGDSFYSNTQSVTIPSEQSKDITFHITCLSLQTICLTDLSLHLYGCHSNIQLPRPIEVIPIDCVPSFNVRFGMLQDSLNVYMGQTLSFPIYFIFPGRNIPDVNISIQPNLPSKISKVSDTHYLCELEIVEQLNDLTFSICCSYKDAPFKSSTKKVLKMTTSGGLHLNQIIELEENKYLLQISNDSQTAFNCTVHMDCGINDFIHGKSENLLLSIGPQRNQVLELDLNEEEIQGEKIISSRLINATASLEARLNRRLTDEERDSITKDIKLICYIERLLTFDWMTSDMRRGHLITLGCIVKRKKHQPKLLIDMPNNGHVKVGEFYDITATGYQLSECWIDLGRFEDPDFEVMWEGSLKYSDIKESEEIKFHLIFLREGEYHFNIGYRVGSCQSFKKEVTVLVYD